MDYGRITQVHQCWTVWQIWPPGWKMLFAVSVWTGSPDEWPATVQPTPIPQTGCTVAPLVASGSTNSHLLFVPNIERNIGAMTFTPINCMAVGNILTVWLIYLILLALHSPLMYTSFHWQLYHWQLYHCIYYTDYKIIIVQMMFAW